MSTQEEEEPPEIKYIDAFEFNNRSFVGINSEIRFRWIDSFEDEDPKWYSLLSDFLSSLAGPSGYCFRVIEGYASVLHCQGAEMIQTQKSGLYNITKSAPRSVRDQGNLAIILKGLSDVTKQVNMAHFMAFALGNIGNNRDVPFKQRFLSRERFGALYLYHIGYRHGLENLLSNYRLLRHFRFGTKKRKDFLLNQIRDLFSERDLHTQSPEAHSLALQMVLEDWNCPLKEEKIVQISHGNTLQMRALHVKGDAFYFLNETLNCGLAMGYGRAQEEMEGFDTIIRTRSTNNNGKMRFQLWRMISKFERSRDQHPRGFLVDAQRLEELGKSEEIGAGCTVLVETACKIRRHCEEQTENIIETLHSTVTRHPSLGPRMLQLADQCGVSYEKRSLLLQICDSLDSLHPSESLWLDYVQMLIGDIGSYGSIRETSIKTVKIMFEFLDFDTNRFNERGWSLFEKVLEMADPSFVVPEWEIRMDWWPKYQRSKCRNGRKLKGEARKKRKAILEALEAIVI